jgi:hypothetical protein
MVMSKALEFLGKRTLANPVYVAQKAWLYSRSRLALQPSDIIIALYPKTGSTWLRFVLYHLLAGSQTTQTFDEVNEAMPEFAHRSMFRKWQFDPVPRLIKTHQPRSFFFGSQPAVLFVRDPRDIMVSFYFYARAKKTVDFDGTLYDLMQDPKLGLEAFFRHYNSWAGHAALVLQYEQLRAEPLRGFRTLVDHLGIRATDEEISRALDLSSVSNMRDSQQSSRESFRKYSKDFVFARKATTGQWREHFGERELKFYSEMANKHGFRLYA